MNFIAVFHISMEELLGICLDEVKGKEEMGEEERRGCLNIQRKIH